MAGDHKCPVCNSTFTRPQHVARHMRSHTGDRPYKCQHCGDQFARSDLLSRHVNKCHASEKPPTTTAPNRRKGPTAASRATTSKQACDQCVQSSLPCDGCNPCSKCVQRKCRCTYVKFHRQTAPQGPGHPPPSALPPHHPHHSRASSSISSSMSAASMPGPSHPRMPDEFVLTPQPGTTSLSAMYSLPGVNTVAQMDYGGYGYAPQRESPTPSLSVSTSTRDSIDGSPEMIRYRAQNEYISRSNLGMGVDVSGMSNVGMSLLPNGTLMQSTGQGVVPGVYEHNQQQQSQNGRYWGSQSFQSEGGKEGLYGSGRLPFPTTNPNGTVTVQAHPSTHQSAQPHHPTGTHAVTSTHQQQQQQQQQSHHTSGEHHHPSPTFPSLSNLAFPSIHSTSTSSQYHHARGGSEDLSDGFGGGGEGSVPSSANSSNVHLPGMLDSPHIGGGSYYQDQGGKDSMIGGRGRGEQGEGGFSSAFGSMSLDDPNVIAGLSNDAPPFFSSLESNSSHASEQSSNTSSGSMHSHSTANTSHQSNVSQLNNNNSSSGLGSFGSSATTPGPLSLSSKEELKEFWKQYMRTPLTGPGVHSPLFPMMTPTASGNNLQLGASGAMGSGIGGDSTTRPTASRRHSRVASMPSMKTPTPMSQLFMFTGVGSEASGSDMGGGGMMYPGPLMDQTPSNFKLYLNREKTAGSFKEPRPPRHHQQQQNNQTGQKVTLHEADDLKSYEQAVLARKAPTHLNLVPKRRGTIHTTTAPPPLSTIMAPPNHTNSRVSSSSNTLPSVAAGMSTGGSKIGELMNRSSPSITASAASSSLADVFGSSRGTSSSASPDPGRSYYSANDNSPTIGSSLANSANPNTGSATLGGAQTSTVYRPSFKRLASQTLGPDNAKRALLGPAGWDEEDEDAIVDDEDWDVTSEDWERDGENASRDRARLPMRRMSCPTGSINGTNGGGVTLPPIYAGIMEANNGSSNAGARRGYPQ